MIANETQIDLPDASSIHLRRARPGDARSLGAFRRQLHAQSRHLNALPQEVDTSWYTTRRILATALDSQHSLILIATLDRQVIGELQLRGTSYHRMSHDKRLAVGVLKAHRGKGIGRALLKLGLDWAGTQSDTKRISLAVHSHNAAALALYKGFGFVEEGRRRGAIGPLQAREPYSDEVLMAYHLKPTNE